MRRENFCASGTRKDIKVSSSFPPPLPPQILSNRVLLRSSHSVPIDCSGHPFFVGHPVSRCTFWLSFHHYYLGRQSGRREGERRREMLSLAFVSRNPTLLLLLFLLFFSGSCSETFWPFLVAFSFLSFFLPFEVIRRPALIWRKKRRRRLHFVWRLSRILSSLPPVILSLLSLFF